MNNEENKTVENFRNALANLYTFGSYDILKNNEEIKILLSYDDETLKEYFKLYVEKYFKDIQNNENDEYKKYFKDSKNHELIRILKKIKKVENKSNESPQINYRSIVKRDFHLNLAVAMYCMENKEKIVNFFISLRKNITNEELKKYSRSYGYIVNDRNIKKYLNFSSKEPKNSIENEFISTSQDYFYYDWRYLYERYNSDTWKKMENSKDESFILKIDIENAFPSLKWDEDEEENLSEEDSKKFQNIEVMEKLLEINKLSKESVNSNKGDKGKDVEGIVYGNTFESYIVANWFLHNFKYNLADKLKGVLSDNGLKLVLINTYVDDNLLLITSTKYNSKDIEEKYKKIIDFLKENNEIEYDVFQKDKKVKIKLRLSSEKLDKYFQKDQIEFFRNSTSYDLGIESKYIDFNEKAEESIKNDKEKSKYKIKETFEKIKSIYKEKGYVKEIIKNIFYIMDNKYFHHVLRFLYENEKFNVLFKNIVECLFIYYNSFVKYKNWKWNALENLSIRNYIINSLLKISHIDQYIYAYAFNLKNLFLGNIGPNKKSSDIDKISFITYDISDEILKFSEENILCFFIKYVKENKNKKTNLFSEENDIDKEDKELKEYMQETYKEIMQEVDKNTIFKNKEWIDKIFNNNPNLYIQKRILRKVIFMVHKSNKTFFWKRFSLALNLAKNRFDLFVNILILWKHHKTFDLNKEGETLPSFHYLWDPNDDKALENLLKIFRNKKMSLSANTTRLFNRIDLLLLFRAYIKYSWKNGSRELDHFSNHGIEHIDNLVKQYKSLRDHAKILNPDSWLIVLSIYIHDISLLDDYLVRNSPIFIEALFELNNKSNSKEELMNSYFELRRKMANAVRNEHGINSTIIANHFYELLTNKGFDKRSLNAKMILSVFQSSRFHNGSKGDNIEAKNKIDANNKYKIFMLSLVDLLDVRYERINRPYINLGTSSANGFTKHFWIKDLSVIENDIKFTKDNFVNFTLRINVAFFKKISKYIEKEVQNKKNENDYKKLELYVTDNELVSNASNPQKENLDRWIDYLIFYFFRTEIKYFDDKIRNKWSLWTFEEKIQLTTKLKIIKDPESKRAIDYKDFNLESSNIKFEWLFQIKNFILKDLLSKSKEYYKNKLNNSLNKIEIKKNKEIFEEFKKNILKN